MVPRVDGCGCDESDEGGAEEEGRHRDEGGVRGCDWRGTAAADDAEAAPLELQKQQAHYGPTTMDHLDEVAAKVRSSSSSSGMSQAECGPTTSDEGERSPALEKPLGC